MAYPYSEATEVLRATPFTPKYGSGDRGDLTPAAGYSAWNRSPAPRLPRSS